MRHQSRHRVLPCLQQLVSEPTTGNSTLVDAAGLSVVVPSQLQDVYLTELFQGGDVLQDHFGEGPLHEVGVHGVGS